MIQYRVQQTGKFLAYRFTSSQCIRKSRKNIFGIGNRQTHRRAFFAVYPAGSIVEFGISAVVIIDLQQIHTRFNTRVCIGGRVGYYAYYSRHQYIVAAVNF